jgi:F0F1-type ATP synthase membrane subunit b/b'
MAILKAIGTLILDFLVNKLIGFVTGIVERRRRIKENERRAEEDKKKLDNANTEKEIDDAARDALGKL